MLVIHIFIEFANNFQFSAQNHSTKTLNDPLFQNFLIWKNMNLGVGLKFSITTDINNRIKILYPT